MPLPKSEEPAPPGNGNRPSSQTTSAALHYTAHARIVAALHGQDVLDKGDTARARCPAHNGSSSTSLSIGPRRDGKGVVVCCHAGCTTKDILAAIGLSMSDLFDEDKARAVYAPRRDYPYPRGRVVHRKPNKDFPQSGNTKDNSLFHANKIGDAQTVYVAEGEKDVEAIELVGGVAVCSAMGAGKAHLADRSPLQGKTVTIRADKDEPGRKHAAQVAERLDGVAASVRIVEAAVGKDAADHIAADKTLDELVPLSYPSETTATPQHCSSDSATPSASVLRIARNTRILDAVGAELGKRGLVGEERLAKTIYLVVTSRLLEKQVSTGVKGHSSSGKSYSVETVLKFFPDEAYLTFTAMSEKALIYSGRDYAHKTIVIYELTALRENATDDDMTSYFVRTLLSEGRIDYEVTVKGKDGNFATKHIVKEGPTNLVFTTTKTTVHAENETRILSLDTDDSPDQTKRILLGMAAEDDHDGDLQDWRDFQQWLATTGNRVTIPFAKKLAELIPPVAVRLRRDFGSLLALIRTHAFLHQATRDRDKNDRIIATADDYEVVRDLVGDVMAHGVGITVSQSVRETVEAVRAEVEKSRNGVGLKVVADMLNVDKSNASRRLKKAAEGGYLRNLEDKRGKPARWVVGDEMPGADLLLPTVAQLAPPVAPSVAHPDLQCCGVAPDLEGIESEQVPDGSDEPDDGGLFEEPSPDGQRCGCGNQLLTPEAIGTGKCKSCRDKDKKKVA
jgi:hypothetical protein